MDYIKLVKSISTEKREKTANKLTDLILSSKNNDKMPSNLANTILYQWQQNLLTSEPALSTLLKAAVLLEQEKTITILKELQLYEVADKIKGEV